MSKYTLINDSSADRAIENELSQLVEVLVESLGSRIMSILLMGSFGKGEGTVIKENGRYRPLNDYGLAICVRRRDSNEVRKKLGAVTSQIESIVSVKQVDIEVIEHWQVMIPTPTTSRYDLSHGHKILYGRRLFIASVPSEFIPLEEGVRYFRNRGTGLLIARLLLDGYGDFPENKRLELAQIEVNKASIVIGDTSLILSGKYHYMYSERLERVQNGLGLGITDKGVQVYSKAVKRKVASEFIILTKRDEVISWLDETIDLYLEHFLIFENIRLKKEFESLDEYLSYFNNVNFRARRLFWSRLWSNEDQKINTNLRIQIFSLLSQLRKIRSNKEDEVWQEKTLHLLLKWRNRGIISELQNTSKVPEDR